MVLGLSGPAAAAMDKEGEVKIVSESVMLAPSVARKTGRSYRQVFYVSNGGQRVGPYHRHIEAVIVRRKIMAARGRHET